MSSWPARSEPDSPSTRVLAQLADVAGACVADADDRVGVCTGVEVLEELGAVGVGLLAVDA